MLVKFFASVAAVIALTLSGAGNGKFASPTAATKPCAAVCLDGGPCPLMVGGCVMEGDCCPDCPLCPDCPVCCGGTAKVSVKTEKSRPAACGQCEAGGKCCVK